MRMTKTLIMTTKTSLQS